jgi:hypothetical protein
VTWRHEQIAEESLPQSGWYRLDTIGELSGLLAEL